MTELTASGIRGEVRAEDVEKPLPINGDEFRRCLGRWASGVSVVTTCAGDVIHGMTVTDFSGTSLSPPLVTVCANRDSITTRLIAEAGIFAVNVLAEDQQSLSNHFASSKTENDRFAGIEYTTGKTGSPLLEGALVNMDCTLVGTHEAGDHVIYVGQIEEASCREGQPLVYWDGAYQTLGVDSDR